MSNKSATIILIICFFVFIAVMIAIFSLAPEEKTSREQDIINYGLDGYCRREASKFIRDAFHDKWGSEAARGDFVALQEKTYKECMEYNKTS